MVPLVAGQLRVLQVHNCYAPGWGGEETVVELEYRLLQKWGHVVEQFQTSHVALKQASTFRQMLATPGMLWSQSNYRKLRQVIAKFNPDVVHVHNTFPHLSPSIFWAVSRADVPVVQTLHNFRSTCANAVLFRNESPCEDCVEGTFWSGLRHRCYGNSFARTAIVSAINALHWGIGTYTAKVNAFIALNGFSQSVFVRSGLPAQKVVVKPNFVPESSLCQAARLSQIVFVGSMMRHKGVHVLLNAWRQANIDGANLLLVGDGPELWALQEQFRDVPRVSWAGSLPHDEVLRRIRESRALVLPTLVYENCPMVLLEAFAEGTPVIVPDLPSMATFVNHQREGLIYSAGHPSALADALTEILTATESVWSNWSRYTREAYTQYYGEATNYQQLISIYRSVIEDRRSVLSHASQTDSNVAHKPAVPFEVSQS